MSLDVIQIRDEIWFAFGYCRVASGRQEVKGWMPGRGPQELEV